MRKTFRYLLGDSNAAQVESYLLKVTEYAETPKPNGRGGKVIDSSIEGLGTDNVVLLLTVDLPTIDDEEEA